MQGRPISAYELGNPDGRLRAVAVACIHGDEPAGIRVVEALYRSVLPPNLDLWLIPEMNPDGRAAHKRVNADQVDLNRNFPWRWRHNGKPGNPMYSGPAPLSEPESRAVHALFEGIEPRLVVWYHQPFGVVDESGGNPKLEGLYAHLVGMPFTELPRYTGSMTSWTNYAVKGATSFVVELPLGGINRRTAELHAYAFVEVARTMIG